MAERRIINFIKLPDGETFQIGGASSGSTYGIQGYYSTHYGIEYDQYGLIEITDSETNEVTVKGGMMLNMPGAETKVTIASDIVKQLESISDLTLFYSSGELIEAGRVYYQLDEPSTEEEIENYYAWFNPTLGKWQFKSNDTGNVWRELVATPIADIGFTNENITSINYIGYRILNDDILASKVSVDNLTEEVNNKVNVDLDNISEAGEAMLRRNTFAMFDTKISDHELTFEESEGWALQGTYVYKTGVAGSRYGYPTFYAKCVEEKELGTATEVALGDNTITMYINSNGHQFYDIADKEAVDTWYNTYGTAWYYGVDTNAERVFLPRTKYFAFTGGVKGNGMTPNFYTTDKGSVATLYMSTTPVGSSPTYNIVGTDKTKLTSASLKLTTDPTKSGITLESDETKHLYICVGNTVVNEALTDVIDITSSENDTLPLGYSTYQADNLSSLAWLKSTGFFESGLTYVTFYNEYRTRIGEVFSGGYVRSVDEDYTDYDLVIDEGNQTFRLPLLDGSENLPDYSNNTINTFTESYTALKDGLIYLQQDNTYDAYFTVYINGSLVWQEESDSGYYERSCLLPISKNDVVTGQGITDYIFYPYKGNGSLYYKVANAVQHLEVVDMLHQAELNNPFFYGMYQYFQTEPNNASWLASLGQWNSKGIYTDYYDWIVDNIGSDYFKLSTDEYTDYDWVVNEVDETFRLPVKVKGASGSAVVGNGVTVGWTDGTNNFGTQGRNTGFDGFTGAYGLDVGTSVITTGIGIGAVNKQIGITTDPTKSGIETSTDGLTLYFYVGETVQNANLINAGRIEEKIARIGSAYMGKPSNRYIDLTLNASGSTYTAPADGWFVLAKGINGNGQFGTLHNQTSGLCISNSVTTAGWNGFIPVKKGDVVKIHYNLGGVTSWFWFVYAEGSK